MPFDDIVILGIDQDASSRIDERSALFDVVLKLSASAPWEWASYFNGCWEREFYMLKRHAEVAGSRITITCVPEELEQEHLPHLNSVIEQTNVAYRAYIGKKEAQEQAQKQQEREDNAALKDLNSRLFKG
jgi:hypothetical protein